MLNLESYKITVFGDSIPNGVYLDHSKIKKIENNAVEILRKILNVNIVNKSIFGQTLKRVVDKGMIDNYIASLDKSMTNVAVISLGGNDSDFRWAEISLTPNIMHDPKTLVSEFDELLDKSITKLINAGVKVVLTSLYPMNAERFFKEVVSPQGNPDHLLEFLHYDLSNLTRHPEAYNAIIKNHADKHNCVMLDYRSELLVKNDFLTYLSNDGIHPNEKGHEFIAKNILNFIETIVL